MNLTYCQAELPRIAQELLDKIPSKIWLFYGAMGSGKTTLIKELVSVLSLADKANSPTFSIVNEYQSRKGKPIYHFDFYRIKSEIEALDMGIDDYFFSGNYCFIEWPENIENLLPLNAVAIYIDVNADSSRTLTIKN